MLRFPSLTFPAAALLSLCASPAIAAVEGPLSGYNTAGTGHRDGLGANAAINDSGLTVTSLTKYEDTAGKGLRALSWAPGDASGTELAILAANASGTSAARAYAVNNSGLTAGTAQAWQGNISRGLRPVVWDAAGGLTQLETLGASASGTANGTALFLNDAGTAAGTSQKYAGGNLAGLRPVRWNTATGAVTELNILETNAVGIGGATVTGLNSSGAVVGNAMLFSIEGENRPVRWDARSVTPVALKPLGFNVLGQAETTAIAINDEGAVLGNSLKYSGAAAQGARGVVWLAGSVTTTDPVELGALTAPPAGGTISTVAMVFNNAGSAAGSSDTWTPGDVYQGRTPVRWSTLAAAAGGLAVPEEMENLGVDPMGRSQFSMNAMNDGGWIAGMSVAFDDAGGILGERAVLWAPDNTILDLNTLLDPGSGWTLTSATDITGTGWVTGFGDYDADGAGPLEAYNSVFRLHLPQAAIPEPGTAVLALLPLAAVWGGRRRREF